MLELEAMDLDRVQTELSAQYVDHNLLQQDYRNPDDHLFLHSACQRFGIWFSRPGNGCRHPVHMQRFGQPGKTLLGSDSHTPAAGAMGMLAIGAGGLEVAMAMAGEPLYIEDAEDLGRQAHRDVCPTGSAPRMSSWKCCAGTTSTEAWAESSNTTARAWPNFRAMDRHVIANMGAELGATSTVFPSDEARATFSRVPGSRR